MQNFIDQQLIQMNGLISLFKVNKLFLSDYSFQREIFNTNCKNELGIQGGGGQMLFKAVAVKCQCDIFKEVDCHGF